MSAPVYDCCVHCDHEPDPAFWHGDPCEDDRCPGAKPLDLTKVPVMDAATVAGKGDCPASDTGGHLYEKQGGQWVCSLHGSPS